MATHDIARTAALSLDNPACDRATLEIGNPVATWLKTVAVLLREQLPANSGGQVSSTVS